MAKVPVPGSAPSPSPWAAFQGAVACRRTGNALILTGVAADSAEEILILTFLAPKDTVMPGQLTGATVRTLDSGRYGITCAEGDWSVEATSVHLHRDIGTAFYRAVPPRPMPLKRRFVLRVMLALAATRAGKRLLLSLRRA
jgi:hypothetical protein